MSEIRTVGARWLACGCATLAVVLSPLAETSTAAQEQALLEDLQRAVEQIQQGRVHQGLAEIEKIIAAEPRLAQAHYYAGMANAQLRRWQQAYYAFVTATEQSPGYGDAHMQACRVAYSLGNLEDAFRHAVLAAQAGVDMSAAFAGLEEAMQLPEGWREQTAVPRVLIGAMDVDAVLQQDSAVFGGQQAEQPPPGADQRGTPPVDTVVAGVPTGASGAFPLPIGSTGSTVVAELQAELHEVRRRFGEELVRSDMFGVVSNVELADYVLFLKVDDVGEGPQFPLEGFVKLLGVASGEEAYSRPLELSNIGSVTDVRNDVARYVGYMEEWLRQQAR